MHVLISILALFSGQLLIENPAEKKNRGGNWKTEGGREMVPEGRVLNI